MIIVTGPTEATAVESLVTLLAWHSSEVFYAGHLDVDGEHVASTRNEVRLGRRAQIGVPPAAHCCLAARRHR